MPDPTRLSPFPGMDPYLEGRWSDVHAKLIGFSGEAKQPLLPRDLRARAEERILLESNANDEGDDDGASTASYRSDLAVVEAKSNSRSPLPEGSAVATTIDPVVIRRFPTPMLDRWVQIVDVSSGGRVVTAIEILSPWNKRAGRLNRQYLRKLEEYARAEVSVVEIDLLRFPSPANVRDRGRHSAQPADALRCLHSSGLGARNVASLPACLAIAARRLPDTAKKAG